LATHSRRAGGDEAVGKQPQHAPAAKRNGVRVVRPEPGRVALKQEVGLWARPPSGCTPARKRQPTMRARSAIDRGALAGIAFHASPTLASSHVNLSTL